MTNAARRAAMRGVAQDPDALAAYLADLQRWLLSVGQDLEALQQETRVDLRKKHVEGDRWYHARMRALPVELTLKQVLWHLEGLTKGLERATFKRHAHRDKVNALPAKRKAKAVAKSRKRNPPVLPSGTGNAETVPGEQGPVYSAPTSVYDLNDRRSA